MGTGASSHSENLSGAIGAATIVGDRHRGAQVCYSCRDGGWLWRPSSPDVSGAKTTLTKEGASRGARGKVQVGLFVCIRVETLVSTALPTSLCCLRFKWESMSTLQLTPHLFCNLTLCFSRFLQIYQLMEALSRVLPASPREGSEHSLCPPHAKTPSITQCHENL